MSVTGQVEVRSESEKTLFFFRVFFFHNEMEKRPRLSYDTRIRHNIGASLNNVKTLSETHTRRFRGGTIHSHSRRQTKIMNISSSSPARCRCCWATHLSSSHWAPLRSLRFVLILIIGPKTQQQRATSVKRRRTWGDERKKAQKVKKNISENFEESIPQLCRRVWCSGGCETHYHSEKSTPNILECLSMSEIAQICFSFCCCAKRHTRKKWQKERKKLAEITCFEWITNMMKLAEETEKLHGTTNLERAHRSKTSSARVNHDDDDGSFFPVFMTLCSTMTSWNVDLVSLKGDKKFFFRALMRKFLSLQRIQKSPHQRKRRPSQRLNTVWFAPPWPCQPKNLKFKIIRKSIW